MGTVKFFSTNDPFGLTDWEVQNGPNPTYSLQRAQALKADGDELAYQQYGGQYSATLNYVLKTVTGTLTLPAVGTVSDGWHLDNLTVSYTQTGWPTLSITCHKHDTSKGGTVDAGCRTYPPSFKVPACFGVPTAIPSTGSGNVFELSTNAEVGLRSISLAVSVNHIDEMNNAGEHFASDNYDGSETLTAEFTGEIDSTDYKLGDAWAADSTAQNGGNTVASTATVTISHHIQHATA